MNEADRRRSARHLLGALAEVHHGPSTMTGVVHDVSQHGMGLELPSEAAVKTGDLMWILVDTICPYAITATVRRRTIEGIIGVEFDEVLEGDPLNAVEGLPLTDDAAE